MVYRHLGILGRMKEIKRVKIRGRINGVFKINNDQVIFIRRFIDAVLKYTIVYRDSIHSTTILIF